MSEELAAPTVDILEGQVVGFWDGDAAAFLGVPYAEPPVGRRRFQPPVRKALWAGPLSATPTAAAPTQPPSRAPSMGPMEVPGCSEDCLTLNVWTRDPHAESLKPVMVWFHGGGFITGSGSAPWYDGAVFADRGDVVVVSVSYRLGALGYLYVPEGILGPDAVANLGLQDQCLALEWVRDNIAHFGGDPNRVTVAGQSAGALSIVGLCNMPKAEGLFHRAIQQSGGPGLSALTVARATEIYEVFCEVAGIEVGDAEALLALPVEAILEAQDKAMMRQAMAMTFDPRMYPELLLMFYLVADGTVLPSDPAKAALDGSMDHIDLMIMCTSEEMRMSLAHDPSWWEMDRARVVAMLEQFGGPRFVEIYAQYESACPQLSPAEVLSDFIGDGTCLMPSTRLAERRAAVGRPAHFVWFTWRSPAAQGRLGACHTAELPFVFNNFEKWSKAPMISEADPRELRELGPQVQDAWISFVRTGDPGWDPYVPPKRTAQQFGSSTGTVEDPDSYRHEAWADTSYQPTNKAQRQ
jgi:para-nitrobenzyl esterase